jgi:hypothetical protein
MTEKSAKQDRQTRKGIDYAQLPKSQGIVKQLGITSVFVTVSKGITRHEGEQTSPQSFFLPLSIAQKLNINHGHTVKTREEYDKLIYAN